MTAMTPQPMEGTQAPSQIEYLYERYRHLLWWIIVLVAAGFGANYAYKAYEQSKTDAIWSSFAASIGLDGTYTSPEGVRSALVDHLADKDLAALEQEFTAAEPSQKPFVLLAMSRRAMLDHNWDRAKSALDELEKDYPGHSLVVASKYPVQVREAVPEDPDEVKKPGQQKEPEYKPAKEGSVVEFMRGQIEKAMGYQRPKQFDKIEPPADAPKVKFEFADYGSFTIALMVEQAPLQCAKFLELAKADYWKDFNVDEVNRQPPEQNYYKVPMQFHLGFASTKEPDRKDWTKTDPSENQVEFEESGLSHFPGAVAARVGTDNKSCADRFWVCYDDCASQDGSRVVFGYIVEGMEVVKRICEAPMPEQEHQAGRGMPESNITVISVTVIE